MRSITAIQADIDSTERAIQAGGVDQSQIDVWNMQIADFKTEIQAAEVQHQEVQQAQAEQIGGLKETIRSIFEASFPKDETVKLMGLTEYESTQQTFNQLIDQAVDEDQTALYTGFQQQLEQRDEKYRLLTLQTLEVQKQFEKANQEANHYSALSTQQEQELEKLSEENYSLQQTASDHDEQLRQRDEEIQRLKQREFDLQQQIANIQTTSQVIDITPTAASESLTERIAQAKVNSKLQLANVTHIAANWVEGINSEGNKEVAHVSDVEQVSTFPTIEPIIQPELKQEATTEDQTFHQENQEAEAANSEGNHSLEGNGAISQNVGENTAQSQVEPTPHEQQLAQLFQAHSELKANHEALTARVERIEEQANIRAVA